MTARTQPIIPKKFPFIHVALSHIVVMFCTILFFEDEKFIQTGKLNSPITLLLIVGELIRWGLSKYVFGLDASNKDFTIFGSRQTSTKNVSIVTHVKRLGKLFGLLVIFVAVFIVACILLGAPYHQKYEETLALSLLLTSLTMFPIALYLGPTKTVQYLIYDAFELNSSHDIWHLEMLQCNAIGTLFGAWAGSIVAPLDWDRPWQAYPIPNVFGALVGFTLANIGKFLTSIQQMSDQTDITTITTDKKIA